MKITNAEIVDVLDRAARRVRVDIDLGSGPITRLELDVSDEALGRVTDGSVLYCDAAICLAHASVLDEQPEDAGTGTGISLAPNTDG